MEASAAATATWAAAAAAEEAAGPELATRAGPAAVPLPAAAASPAAEAGAEAAAPVRVKMVGLSAPEERAPARPAATPVAVAATQRGRRAALVSQSWERRARAQESRKQGDPLARRSLSGYLTKKAARRRRGRRAGRPRSLWGGARPCGTHLLHWRCQRAHPLSVAPGRKSRLPRLPALSSGLSFLPCAPLESLATGRFLGATGRSGPKP